MPTDPAFALPFPLSAGQELPLVHHAPIPPRPTGMPPRTYRNIANDSGFLTRTVGMIEGEDGTWPILLTEHYTPPPPVPMGYSAAMLERTYWRGLRHGAFFALVGACAGLVLFCVGAA